MASLVRHPEDSWSSTSSSMFGQSFSSRGSRRPGDSLENTRGRRDNGAQASCGSLPLTEGISIQESNNTEGAQSLPLTIVRHPINCTAVSERYPKGKASLLVFLLILIVVYAYGAAISGILNIFHVEKDVINVYQESTHLQRHSLHIIKLLLQYCVSRIFFPATGFIADVYIGRWRMIHISILLLLSGYVIMVLNFALHGQMHLPSLLNNAINGMAFLLLSIGGGGFVGTIIPFGVDQLQGASSAEISSYFYFFYFSHNLGMGLSILVSCLLSYTNKRLIDAEGIPNHLEFYAFQPLVTTAILSVGLVLMICFHHWFFKSTLWENPVKLIAKILCYAARVRRHLPVRNRAFRYGEERKSRIELAKFTYDGKFPDEKVEDVKAFCRIVFILVSLIPTMFSINAFYILISQEASLTLNKMHHSVYLEINLYNNACWAVNIFAILLALPVVNFLVIPSFPKLTIRARIGIGLVLYCIGSVAVVLIHAVPLSGSPQSEVSGVQLAFLIVPVLIFAVAEVLTSVSVLEFIYAQSPESMKGLLTGLYYCFFGLSSIPGAAAYYLYQISLENKILLPFHTAFTVIMVVGTVFYMVAAALYRNRQRHYEDSLQQRLIIENQLHSTLTA